MTLATIGMTMTVVVVLCLQQSKSFTIKARESIDLVQ